MTKRIEQKISCGMLPVGNERSSFVRGGLVVDPDNLVLSLADVLTPSSLPLGITHYSIDHEISKLIPLSSDIRPPLGSIGIENIVYEDGQYINIDNSSRITHTHTQPRLQLIFDTRTNLLSRVEFGTGLVHYEPMIFGSFKPDKTGLESKVKIIMPIVPNISGFELNYAGDEHHVAVTSVEDYTREQLAIIFKNGHVPPVDFQKFIYELIFLDDSRKAGQGLVLPELTFSPDKNDYHPGHSTTYLIQSGESLPSIKEGETIEGVSIVEVDSIIRTGQPFHVSVKIKDIEEILHEYKSGPRDGKVVQICAKATVSDGRNTIVFDKPFVVFCDFAYLKNHPELVPGSAFASVDLDELKNLEKEGK